MKKVGFCGGEGGFSFSNIVMKNIELLPKYKQEKATSFWYSIEIDCCKAHDEDFLKGGFIFAFLKANFIFSYRFCLKLWWTNIFLQILSFPLLFLGTSIFGIKYFNWKLGTTK